jgi:hypothetical protein
MMTTFVLVVLLALVLSVVMSRRDLWLLDSFVRQQAAREADRESRLETALRRLERLEADRETAVSQAVAAKPEGLLGGRVRVQLRYADLTGDSRPGPRGVAVGEPTRPITVID